MATIEFFYGENKNDDNKNPRNKLQGLMFKPWEV